MSGQRRVRTWHFGDAVEELRQLLDRGGVLAIPTESSYGLAVDPRNRAGVEAVYEIKGRDSRKPLPVVVADIEQIHDLGVRRDLPQLEALAPLWPAPLTLVLPCEGGWPALAGGATLAARVPAHEPLRGLLAALQSGLTATSANPSGESPIRDPRDLVPLLEGFDAIVVDAGPLPPASPSTLVEWRQGTFRVLRPGAFPMSRLPDV